MIGLSPEAEAHLDDLLAHFERKDRIEAARNLLAALETASERIERNPEVGLPAPKPYPQLAKAGRLWLHVRRYWFAYSTTMPPVFLAVAYDESNMPRRL